MYPFTVESWKAVKGRLQQALAKKEVQTCGNFEHLIVSYNKHVSRLDGCGGLKECLSYYSELLIPQKKFFNTVFPSVVNRALQFEELFPTGIPLLTTDVNQVIQMSRQQVACILANQFLCTFHSDFRLDGANFHSLFCRKGHSQDDSAKLAMFINYFIRIKDDMSGPPGCIYYRRISVPKAPNWAECDAPLCEVTFADPLVPLDEAADCLQVDFANKHIGGGVLTGGSVQEEIRFSICPELTASLVFTPVMNPHEAVILTGSEWFSHYSGYGHTLKFSGDATDETPWDEDMHCRASSLVAIDALKFPGRDCITQLNNEILLRELGKAYAGMQDCSTLPDVKVTVLGGPEDLFQDGRLECPISRYNTVATGNWGCGVFGGVLEIKFLVQWMALSAATPSRSMRYYPYDQADFSQRAASFIAKIKEVCPTVGHLYRALNNLGPWLERCDRSYANAFAKKMYHVLHLYFQDNETLPPPCV